MVPQRGAQTARTQQRHSSSQHTLSCWRHPPGALQMPFQCTRSKDTLEERKAGRTHFLDCKYFISNAIPFCALPSAPMLVPMLVLQQQSFYFFFPLPSLFLPTTQWPSNPSSTGTVLRAVGQCWPSRAWKDAAPPVHDMISLFSMVKWGMQIGGLLWTEKGKPTHWAT